MIDHINRHKLWWEHMHTIIYQFVLYHVFPVKPCIHSTLRCGLVSFQKLACNTFNWCFKCNACANIRTEQQWIPIAMCKGCWRRWNKREKKLKKQNAPLNPTKYLKSSWHLALSTSTRSSGQPNRKTLTLYHRSTMARSYEVVRRAHHLFNVIVSSSSFPS